MPQDTTSLLLGGFESCRGFKYLWVSHPAFFLKIGDFFFHKSEIVIFF
jgi:hypothetical protein